MDTDGDGEVGTVEMLRLMRQPQSKRSATGPRSQRVNDNGGGGMFRRLCVRGRAAGGDRPRPEICEPCENFPQIQGDHR